MLKLFGASDTHYCLWRDAVDNVTGDVPNRGDRQAVLRAVENEILNEGIAWIEYDSVDEISAVSRFGSLPWVHSSSKIDRVDTLTKLWAAKDCVQCDFVKTNHHTVGVGNLEPKYFYLYDFNRNSTQETQRSHVDFGGANYLRSALFLAGILSDVWFTNTLKCQFNIPGKNLLPRHNDECYPFLKTELEILQPEVILEGQTKINGYLQKKPLDQRLLPVSPVGLFLNKKFDWMVPKPQEYADHIWSQLL